MFEGWAALGGQEIVNNERYAVYALELGLPAVHSQARCPELAAVLADDPYADAGVAGAPWYDAGAPESGEFAGVFVSSVTGLDASTTTRQIVPTIDGGGIVTPPLNAPRTILFTAWLAAGTPRALEYGLAWLSAALRDDCPESCEGATLCMLAACPDCDTSAPGAADDCWEYQTRTLHNVVCVDGPRVVERHELPSGGNCDDAASPVTGVAATVEFTLTAGTPFIYRAPAVIATALGFTDPPPADGCGIQWIEVGAGRAPACPVHDDCAPAPSCLTDPSAPARGWLPWPPPPPRACVTRFRTAWATATAASDLLPRWLESVPVVTVRPGDGQMRRLTLRFYANPNLAPVTGPDDLDPCGAMAELNVPYLPRDVELVIDGRTREVYAACPGGAREPAAALVYGADGGPFEWPVLACGAPMTVLALVDADHYDAGATLDVSLSARQDVG